ncbi:hypothetical protein ACX0G9_03435 [Flavitalea flava]
MHADLDFLAHAKNKIEEKLGWGKSVEWANQDFIALSKKIQQETGASVSHITLKRIWGKVKYEGLPQMYTLNTLVQFIGYESWREFKVKNAGDYQQGALLPEMPAEGIGPVENRKEARGKSRIVKQLIFVFLLICLAAAAMWLIPSIKKKIPPGNYAFSSKRILTAGIPNSVVFNFDATKAPSDSVVLQQSWDNRLRTKISKDQHQHTLIYYYPGFFNPKLVVNDQIVKELDLLIRSDGWVTAMAASPVPVYFNKKDVVSNGKMSLPIEKIKAQNVPLTPQAPLLSYCNVPDLGEIYTDDFVFETFLRNDYREGSSVCQMSNIYLLCEGTAVGIPLCAKGCESAINFFFTDYKISGKEKDLSAFGVDFNNFVKVRVESANGKASIFLNGKFVLQADHITRSKIIGIDFVFQGTGSVDYVRLSNKKVSFDDEF